MCVCVCVCVFSPSYVALWDSRTPHRPTDERVSWCLETSPLWLPPKDESSSPTRLSFWFLYFALPLFKEKGLPFWVPGVLRQLSEVVLWKLLSIQMIFWWICGGESGLPLIPLSSLNHTPPPTFSFKIKLSICYKEIETHFSILAWEIPWTEEPGGL